MKLAVYYKVEKPDNASDRTMQFTITSLFPKKREVAEAHPVWNSRHDVSVKINLAF